MIGRAWLKLRKLAWFLAAWLVLAAVRAGLSLASYRRLVRWMPVRTMLPPPPLEVQARCRWALTRASRWVPGATCLTQAYSGRWMLDRLGYGSTIVIGVAQAPDAEFRAHAWLKAVDDIIVGGDEEDLASFTRLTDLGVST